MVEGHSRALPEARRSGFLYQGKVFVKAAPSELATVCANAGAAWSVFPKEGESVVAFSVLVFAALLSAVVGISKIVSGFRDSKAALVHPWEHGFLAASMVLQQSIGKVCQGVLTAASVRVALYRVVPPIKRPQHIQQLIDTLGGSQGTAGRMFPVGQGIVGRAIRTGDVMRLHRPKEESAESYVALLKKEYGYTAEEAQEVSKDRYSMLAVPITGSNGQTVAVVYLDSLASEVFSDDVVAHVVACLGGLRGYISERLNV